MTIILAQIYNATSSFYMNDLKYDYKTLGFSYTLYRSR